MDASLLATNKGEVAGEQAEDAPSKLAIVATHDDDDDVEDEDDAETAPTYIRVDDLAAHGANAAEVSKLLKRGFSTVGLVASASLRELTEIPGISTDRAEFLRKKAKLADCNTDVAFVSGIELVQTFSNGVKITTGCASFDTMIGGGVESRTITEVFGDSSTGKTQLCHSLCVRCQLPIDQGGAEGCALYVDTDRTFRPDRIQEIADAAGFDSSQVLENVTAITAKSFEHQCEILTAISGVLADPPNGEFRLIVVDSVMSHLRAEYAGRGDLSARQQALNQHLRSLKRLADAFNCAVVVTNQVSTVPESFGMGAASVKPCGGPIMAHSAAMRISLRKGRGSQKKALLEHSAFMPKERDIADATGECFFSVTAAGICEAIEA